MIQAGSRAQGFAAGEYVATQFVVERDADASANAGQSDAAAADSTHAIMRRFIARLAIEPGIVGATVTSVAPWDGGSTTLEADGVVTEAKRATVMTVDTSFFKLFGARMLGGRAFTASDVPLRDADRPVVVNAREQIPKSVALPEGALVSPRSGGHLPLCIEATGPERGRLRQSDGADEGEEGNG